MIHSFNVIENNNGNTTVVFYQDSKQRSIIFTKDTEAQKEFWRLITLDIWSHLSKELVCKSAIRSLKVSYLFKANVNNKSIFRPIHKSLILNT